MLDRLIDHLEWADAAALDALRGAPSPDERAVTIYAHILGAEATWLARIAGRPADIAVWPVLTLDAAAALAARNAAELRQVVEGATFETLSREITYRTSAGDEFRSSLEDILLHVALHGAYHRGQVALIVRGAGATPNPTDYIAFARGAPAARTPPPIPITGSP